MRNALSSYLQLICTPKTSLSSGSGYVIQPLRQSSRTIVSLFHRDQITLLHLSILLYLQMAIYIAKKQDRNIFVDIFLAYLAVISPPLTVWIKSGFFSLDFWLNIWICIILFLIFPWFGTLHAWYVIIRGPKEKIDYHIQLLSEPQPRAGRGRRVTITYVSDSDDSDDEHHGPESTQEDRPRRRGRVATTKRSEKEMECKEN